MHDDADSEGRVRAVPELVASDDDAPIKLSSVEPRFGDWGPGYLEQRDDVMFGVVTLRPGDDFGNHIHEHHTESFLVLKGSAEVWFERSECVVIVEGDLIGAPPNVEHYFRNVGDMPFTAFFIKTPGVQGDKVDLPWLPEGN